jgi:hypothetical protein
MIASATFNPVIVEGHAARERSQELKTRGRGSPKLDYKEALTVP